MHSTKSSQGTSARRASGPISVNTRQNSQPAPNSGVSAIPATKPAALQPTLPSATAISAPTGDQTTSPTGVDFFKPPLVMTPVSQISRGPRRNSRPEVPVENRPKTWDPEHYNPDGSLRTMHKLPGFDQSYAQAMNARYVRHSVQLDREKELSVNEIFGRSEKQ